MSYHNIRIKGIPAPLATDYDRQVSFTDFEVLNPGEPPRGVDLDAEFNSVEQALDETQDRLRLIQRDDGALRNQSVGRDQLKAEAMIGVNPPRPWQPFTQYAVNDSVIVNGNSWFVAEVSHVSSDDFEAENALGYWRELLDLTPFTTEARNWAEYPQDTPVPEGDGSEYSALHHAGYAAAAQGAAETAQGAAETARDLSQAWAETAEDVEVEPGAYSSLHHRAKAEAAQGLSEAARDQSQAWAETAEDVEVEPGAYSSLHHRAKAEAAQASAETAQGAAETAQGLSEAARDQSQAWAETAEDVEVEPGAYSSLHHRAKAEAAQGAAETAATTATAEADRAENYADVLATPVGQPIWWPARGSVPAGLIVYDGQLLSRATYPDLWDFAQVAGLVETEVDWQADPAKRGKFSDGDGSTTFRVPDFNGQSAGSLGAVYLTGDGHKTAGTAGTIREDEMQQITGSAELPGASITDTDGAISSFETTSTTIGGTGSSTTRGFDFDSANSPGARTNTYTHGTDVSGVWCGRGFGAVVNVGSADAAQLASDYANLAGLVSALDADKLDKVNAIAGEGYQWHDETANRSFGVEYTNSRGKPISVAIRIPSVGSALPVEVSHDGVTWVNLGITSTNSALFYCFEVPDGHLYRINNSFLSWSELY